MYITYFVEEPANWGKIWIYIYICTNDVCIDILFKVAVRCESFQILEMAWWTLKKNEVRSKVSVFLICLTCLFFPFNELKCACVQFINIYIYIHTVSTVVYVNLYEVHVRTGLMHFLNTEIHVMLHVSFPMSSNLAFIWVVWTQF